MWIYLLIGAGGRIFCLGRSFLTAYESQIANMFTRKNRNSIKGERKKGLVMECKGEVGPRGTYIVRTLV